VGVVDIIILICFLPGIVQGLRKGLIMQLVSFSSLLVSIWAAIRYHEKVSEWLETFITAQNAVLTIISYAAIIFAVIIVLNIVGKLITKLLSMAALGLFNRFLGMVFAILETVLILGLVISAFDALNTIFSMVEQETLDSSVLYGWIKSICQTVFPSLKNLITNA